MCAAHHFTQQDIVWRQHQQPVPGKVTSFKADLQLHVSDRIWTLDNVSSSALIDLATWLNRDFLFLFFLICQGRFINSRNKLLINACRMKTLYYSFQNNDFKLWIYELSQTVSKQWGKKKQENIKMILIKVRYLGEILYYKEMHWSTARRERTEMLMWSTKWVFAK